MPKISEHINVNIEFEKILKFLISEQLPQIENEDKLEFVSNEFSKIDDYTLLVKTIIFPIQRKNRGFLSSLLGLNKFRIVYNIRYDNSRMMITVTNPREVRNFVTFRTEIFIEKKGCDTSIRKEVSYRNKIPFMNSSIEDDFFSQNDVFFCEMLRRCQLESVEQL